ncbi:MAG: hypothetical protein JW795_24055, partial [Chitinivibrionales bacterium]|nr:hypothetical protein [Chitinivibrionales bacterium]
MGADRDVGSLAEQAINAGATKKEIAEALHVAYHLGSFGSAYTASRGLQSFAGTCYKAANWRIVCSVTKYLIPYWFCLSNANRICVTAGNFRARTRKYAVEYFRIFTPMLFSKGDIGMQHRKFYQCYMLKVIFDITAAGAH